MSETDFKNRCGSFSYETEGSHADFETLHSISDNTLDSTGNGETRCLQEQDGHRQEVASHPQEEAGCSNKETGQSQEAASHPKKAVGCSSKATGYSQETANHRQEEAGFSSKATGYSREAKGFSSQADLRLYGKYGQPLGAAVDLQAAAVYLKAADDYPPGKDVYPHAVAVCLHAVAAHPHVAGVYQHAAAGHFRTPAGPTDEATELTSVLRQKKGDRFYVPSKSAVNRIGDFEDPCSSVIMLRWKFMKVAIDLKSWRIKTREQSRILSSYVNEGDDYFSMLNDTSTVQKLSDQEICFVCDAFDRLGSLCLMFDQNNEDWFSIRFRNACAEVAYLLSRIRDGEFAVTKENAEEILKCEKPLISSVLNKMKYLKPHLRSYIMNTSQTLESMHFLLSKLRSTIKK